MASEKTADVAASISKLTIDPAKSKPSKPSKPTKPTKPKKKKVVDSWEDEDVSSDDDSTPASPAATKTLAAGTAAPPPTPLTPSYHQTTGPTLPSSSSWSTPDVGSGGPARRPEKTDAVARRMIASALGVRAPKQTDEQRAYQKSLREAERKRREDEREAQKKQQEAQEEAKRAIWED